MGQELYEQVYQDKRHFSFGKNWLAFMDKLDDERVIAASESLTSFLDVKSLRGKSFIDVGCGSGLFSLAAYSLGANVTSIDADKHSITSTTNLKKRFAIAQPWKVKHGSVLQERFVRSLGTHDIVYSWGVLHHTGDMRKAFDNVDLLVKKRGLLFIAIYNDNTKHKLEGTSAFWKRAKRRYNKTNKAAKWCIEKTYTAYLLAGITVTGKNPVRYVKSYRSLRGMDFWTDIKDWLGGHPYEYATTSEIEKQFTQRGYELIRVKAVRSLGCNEFLFRKR